MNEFDMSDQELEMLMMEQARKKAMQGGDDEGMGLGGMAALGAGALGAGLAATPIGRPLRGLIDKGMDAAGPMVGKAVGAMEDPFMSVAGPVGSAMGNAAQGIGGKVRQGMDAIGDSPAGMAMQDAAMSVAGPIGSAAGLAKEAAPGIASALGAPLKEAGAAAAAPFKAAWQGGSEALDAAAMAKGGRTDFADPFSFSGQALKQNFGETVDMMKGAGRGFKDSIMPPSAAQAAPTPVGAADAAMPMGGAPDAPMPPPGPSLDVPLEGTPFNPKVRGTDMPIPPPIKAGTTAAERLKESFEGGAELSSVFRNDLVNNAMRAGDYDDATLNALGRALNRVARPEDRWGLGNSWKKGAKDSFGAAFKERSPAEKTLGKAFLESSGFVSTSKTIDPDKLQKALSVVDSALKDSDIG